MMLFPKTRQLKQNVHVVLLQNDIEKMIKALNLFAIDKLLIIRGNEAINFKKVDELKQIFEPRVEVQTKIIDDRSYLQASMDLMMYLYHEALEENCNIFMNITGSSSSSSNVKLALLTCSQFANLHCYQAIYDDSGELKVKRIDNIQFFPLQQLSNDQFELFSIITLASQFNIEFTLYLINSEPRFKNFFFQNFNEPIEAILQRIKQNIEIFNSTKYIQSLESLVYIINPGIKNPSKKFNSERARLAYHLKQFKFNNLIEFKKIKRKLLCRSSWIGVMYFYGEIIKKMKEFEINDKNEKQNNNPNFSALSDL